MTRLGSMHCSIKLAVGLRVPGQAFYVLACIYLVYIVYKYRRHFDWCQQHCRRGPSPRLGLLPVLRADTIVQ